VLRPLHAQLLRSSRVGSKRERPPFSAGLPREAGESEKEEQGKQERNSLIREIFHQRVYTQHGVRIRDGDFVVDVGANVGVFAQFACAQARNLSVHSFEPLPPNFQQLREVATRASSEEDGRHNRVTAHQLALAEAAGRSSFTWYPGMPGESTRWPRERAAQQAALRALTLDDFRAQLEADVGGNAADLPPEATRAFFESMQQAEPDASEAPQTFECEVSTLTQLLPKIAPAPTQRINLLKVDVEGDELGVLRGMGKGDWARVDQVVVEVHNVREAGTDRLLAVVGLLIDAGFGQTHVERQKSVLHDDGFLAFVPPQLALFYVYGVRE
jgi:FkbM family methyltransferase